MTKADPFVKWISSDDGAPAGFSRDDNSRGSLATYPESPDEAISGVTYGSLELRYQVPSLALSTTPLLMKPETLVNKNGLIDWDATNGIVTVLAEGAYDFLLMANAGSANQRTLYFYAELDTGSGFQIGRYTARQQRITANQAHQSVFVSTNYFAKNTRYKIYLFASANDVTLNTQDIVGFEGVLTVPAVRMMVSGAR